MLNHRVGGKCNNFPPTRLKAYVIFKQLTKIDSNYLIKNFFAIPLDKVTI